jgi:hypothetical protein
LKCFSISFCETAETRPKEIVLSFGLAGVSPAVVAPAIRVTRRKTVIETATEVLGLGWFMIISACHEILAKKNDNCCPAKVTARYIKTGNPSKE